MIKKRLGDILLERSLVSLKDIDQALTLQKETHCLLGQALIRIGAVSEEDLLSALSYQLDISILDPKNVPSDQGLFDAATELLGVEKKWLKNHKAVIWIEEASEPPEVILIAHDILNPAIRERIESACYYKNVRLKDYLSHNHILEGALKHINDEQVGGYSEDADIQHLRELAEGAPIIDFVNRVFSGALKANASDIHIEPFEDKFQVRYRVDGVLHHQLSDAKSNFDAVVSRIKILSGMDIAERRLPQDGRQSIRFAGQEIDLRVSSLPGTWGESLVLRLLKKESNLPTLESLGLEGRSQKVLSSLLSKPNGVILVTGPTGSGKSTTLYRSLQGLNNGIRKIITIEDPVEYDMDGIIQIQTKSSIGYTFAKGLRAILRQDPDIIMVGEIRDGETASIAAQAALTGHLVLSTLHTNSSLAAVARLVDIGLEPYMVASSVRGLVAQRLVRRLCNSCKVSVENKAGDNQVWDLVKSDLVAGSIEKSASWKSPKGCEACSHTGYNGRVALYEISEIDDELSDAIQNRASLQQLQSIARKQGFLTLLEDGLLKARKGITSLTEVQRVCGSDNP